MYFYFILVLVEQLNNLKIKHHQKDVGQRARKLLQTILFYFSFLSRSKNFWVWQKEKNMEQIKKEEQVNLHNKDHQMKLIFTNDKPIFNSFGWRCSSAAKKMMPKDPEQAVCMLLHILDQFSRCPITSTSILQIKAEIVKTLVSLCWILATTRVGKMRTE